MNDLDRLLKESLKSVGEGYRPMDVAAARERFLKRRRRRLTFLIASTSVATAAAVVLAFFLVRAPERGGFEGTGETDRLAVQGVAEVADSPRAVVAGGGVVWVTDSEGLARLDPDSGAVIDHVELEGPGDIVLSTGTLWVAESGSGVVHRLDPRTGEARGTALTVGDAADTGLDLAVGLDGLWVAGLESGAVQEFDRDSGELLEERSVEGFAATEVAAGEGQIWAYDGSTGRVVRIARASRALGFGSEEAESVPASATGNDIALGLGSLWVGSGATGELYVTDLESGQRRVVEVGGSAVEISLGPTEAWALASSADRSRLFRLSPDGVRVGDPLPIDAGAAGISAGEGAVWVTLPDENSIARVLTTEQEEIEERDAPSDTIPAQALLFAYIKDGALLGMYGDGSERLIAEEGGGWNPAISPNARTLLYTVRNDSGVTELRAIDIAAPDVPPVVVGEGVAPSFGPGLKAAWLTPFEDPSFAEGELVFGKPSRGGKRIVLDLTFADGAVANRVHWDAGGEAVYVVSEQPSPGLYRVDLPQPLRSTSVEATLVEPDEEGALYLAPTSRGPNEVNVIKLCCPGTTDGPIESAELGVITFEGTEPRYEPIVDLGDIVKDTRGLKLAPAGRLDVDAEAVPIEWTMGDDLAWLVRYLSSVWLVDASGHINSLARLADVGIGSAPGLIRE